MATTLDVTSVPARRPSSRWRMDRAFFTGMSLAMVAAVFIGFSRSYYLKAAYGTPQLPLLFHVHGLLFTGWMLLLIVQTALVATRRTPVHRQLGVAGGVLALLMTVAAAAMTIDLARRSAGAPDDAARAAGLAFAIIPFFTVIVFPVLVGAAIAYRRTPDIHKRLMLIATLELTTAGVARIPGAGSVPLFFILTDIGLLALVAYDVVSRRRLHPATMWAGLFLIATQAVRTYAGGTDAWLSVARMLAA